MIRCKECNETFPDRETAEEHVSSVHAEICDERLQEYIIDSITDACDDLLEED